MERSVSILNHRAMIAANRIAAYKSALLSDILSCNIFTTNYPLLIDHVLREAKFYLRMLTKLQKREELNMAMEAAYQEKFWNRIMAEHAKFIRGLLDPTEEKLFDTANDFEKRFDVLTAEAQILTENLSTLPAVTARTLETTVVLEILSDKLQRD